MIKAILRYFSYLFHTLLCLFLLGLSGIAITSGAAESLRLGMLPWSGQTLEYVLFFGALAGLATVLLALKGTLRILFLLWSFVVFVLIVKSYFISMYVFRPNEFRLAVYLAVGSFVALIGAWAGLRTSSVPRKY
jgi:hypothetical protein